MFIIRFTTIWLIAALIVIGTWSSEASRAENASIRLKDNYNTGSARALLKPPNTSSPRTTLKSFMENMDRAYGLLMKAHRENLKTPGFFLLKTPSTMKTIRIKKRI